MTERTATARQPGGTGARSAEDSAAAGFERLYRANVEAVTSYFARRSADPHVVADLTADTFVTAITSFASFDPGKGSARSWVFGIARHVYAAHCEAYGQQQDRLERLAGRRDWNRIRSRNCSTALMPNGRAAPWSPGLACCPTGTARWSSWWISPARAPRRRRPCSGSRRARCGCG
ncbi:MAG TPA: sigma factor [Streptosporangiaceae bacterium]|nr:sigma factor [Streptosporangiaceae bacterium]